MSRVLPLVEFADQAFRAPSHFGFAEGFAWIPLNDTEYHVTAHHLPLAVRFFGGRPLLGALTRPDHLQRPVVDADGRWRAGYLPLVLRTHPFVLSTRRGERPIDAIDVFADSGLIGAEGNPVCTDPATGTLSPATLAIVSTLNMMVQGRQRLSRALDLLTISDVLVPLRDGDRGDSVYFTVDPNRLARLGRLATAALARETFLPLDLATALVFSRRHVHPDRLPLEDRSAPVENGTPRGDLMDFVLANLETMNFVLDGSDLFELDDMLELTAEPGPARPEEAPSSWAHPYGD